jgi:putative transposase
MLPEITEILSFSSNVDVERKVKLDFTRKITGIDLGLESFYTDSQGRHIGKPRLLRKPQRALKEL